MNPIDSVLQLLVAQGGTELRLTADRRPQMFRDDVELPLTMPPLPAERIRDLLHEIWTQNAPALHAEGTVRVAYDAGELGRFSVWLADRGGGAIEARVRRGDGHDTARPAEPAFRPREDTSTGHGETAALPVPDALVTLLARVAALGASDVHLSPDRAPIIRVNGALASLDGEARIDARALLADGDERDRIRAGASVDRAFTVPAVGRIRVNVYASQEGVCAAVRILQREVPELAALDLPPQLAALVELPHGLIIACGPTGSGKSTTLAALAQHALRSRPRVLVTLEDPIEYVIAPGSALGLVRQREVGTHVRDFATGLRDALREDPDVLLIGEMRDPETIGLALTAAETGHLVLASLHSRTAPSAIERIVDTYPPERQRQIRVQLADALRAVIAQRLLPAATGQGRVPVVELLRVTHGVANLIREGRTAQIVNALQAGGSDGMLVLERSLADLVRARRIRQDTALATANDPAALADYLRGAR